ncbi:hypothetical protein [Acetobacter senegalensis]|uniref:hypothetical protein n=1 Tax=Acetobacter senegalensis TaxID=446692 RepID=UPI001EDD63D0|nr:hypothetical protein [Acetobacter senegalensis]MCG4273662.1 hypothetical protein [Acetobacter senegalensis]
MMMSGEQGNREEAESIMCRRTTQRPRESADHSGLMPFYTSPLVPSLPWRQANSPGVLLHYPLDDEAHATDWLDFPTPFALATNACCPSAPM